MHLPISHRLLSSGLLAVCLIFGLTACNDYDLPEGPSISRAVQQRFQRLDQNQDGWIAFNELNRPALFRRVDDNDDGYISLQEASDFIEQRRAARRASYAPVHSYETTVTRIPSNDQIAPPVQAAYPVRRAWRQAPGDYASDDRYSMPENRRYAASGPVSARPLRLARDGDDLPVANTNKNRNRSAAADTVAVGGVRQFFNLPYATIPGVDPNLLSLDVYAPATGQNHPVIVMVHGGGWQRGDKANTSVAGNKPLYFTRAGYVFISINYRLSPAVRHPAHVQDVAKALAWTADNVSRYGGDPTQIYLMGHSSGAHLAALVATDQRYLQAVGENLQLLKGVILLDGAGYDIPKLMREHNQPRIYVDAFGNDERVWRDASPVTHVAPGKNIPPFLIFYTPRTRAQMLSRSLSESLERAGVPVTMKISNKSHAQINREVGQAGDGVTQSIMEFLK